ncbi:hypothetical protein BBJ28_00004323 [Nothophytophthora sp. Chile5]|nr:hypothetical protein BBJ28_00004323 [Nothophytophthora sp. Chile5]
MEMAGVEGDKARVDADTVPAPTRYTFLELKEAQRICGLKMTAAALRECGTASAAQKEIFRAHVSDLCATIFSAALRKYNPEDKEDVAPVDEETAAQLAALETKLKEKEAAVKKLRERVRNLMCVYECAMQLLA